MSELTRCNFCSFEALKRRYGVENLVLVPDDGWIAVHMIGYERDKYGKPTEDPIASFMVLTAHCVC